MDTKQYLSQISRLDKMINENLCEIFQLRNSLIGKSVANDNVRVTTSSDKDKVGSIVSKIVDLEKETDILVDKLTETKRNILHTICKLSNDKHKEILYKKYFEYKSIYEIAEELNMSDRGCKKAHKRAVEEFEKINKHNILCFA